MYPPRRRCRFIGHRWFLYYPNNRRCRFIAHTADSSALVASPLSRFKSETALSINVTPFTGVIFLSQVYLPTHLSTSVEKLSMTTYLWTGTWNRKGGIARRI